MATLDDRIYALISRLIELTNSGELRWERGGTSDMFEAATSSGVVEIESARGGRTGSYPYTLRINDHAGEEVERIDTLGPEDELGPWDVPLRDLYIAARANALDIAGTVDGLLQSLGVDPGQVPPRPDTSASPDDDIPF